MSKIWNKKIKIAALIMFTFLFLYFPPFISIGTHYFLAVLAYGYIAFNLNSFFLFLKKKTVFYPIMLIVCLLLYVAFIAALNHQPIKAAVYGPLFWIVVYMPICFCILNTLKKEKATFHDLIMVLVACCNIQGLLSVVSFVFPPFHTWVLNRFIMYGYDADRYTSLSYYRLYGLAFHLTNYAPLVAVAMTVIMIKYALKDKRYLVTTPLMIISIVLNSRTALVLLLLGSAFVIFTHFKKLTVKTLRRLTIGICSAVVVVALGAFALKSMQNSSNSWYAGWVLSGFEQIGGLFKGEKSGYFNYASSDSIWTVPSDMMLIFGSGKDAVGMHYGLKGTDVGYINYLWIGGIVYLLGIFGLAFLLIKPFYKSRTKWLFFFFSMVFVIINVKDILFTQNEFMCFLFLISYGVNYLGSERLLSLLFMNNRRNMLPV